MNYSINGFHDFYTILSNERKVGGAIEAEQLQLRSGETFNFPVFTNIDFSGTTFYTIGFITSEGVTMIVNVSDIASIKSPIHKKVLEVKNLHFKEMKLKVKNNYLKRLYKADQGALTQPFVDEVTKIIEDIGIDNVSSELNTDFLNKNNKIVKIA